MGKKRTCEYEWEHTGGLVRYSVGTLLPSSHNLFHILCHSLVSLYVSKPTVTSQLRNHPNPNHFEKEDETGQYLKGGPTLLFRTYEKTAANFQKFFLLCEKLK